MTTSDERLCRSLPAAAAWTAAAWTALAAGTALPSQSPAPGDPRFEETWHAGVAELNRYDLRVARYGEVREGTAVLVFVTEPFRPREQVKAESAGGPRVPVLKLNRIERFVTGIYDYSMMASVFTPYGAEPRPTLKVTASVQDWCGQVWMQLNRQGGTTHLTGHSYFEAEGEEDRELDTPGSVAFEDGLWTRIRLAPESLPTGEIRIVPGVFHSRLRHQPLEVATARAALVRTAVAQADGSERDAFRYEVDYGSRRLRLFVARAWPHGLLGWTEERRAGSGWSLLSEGTRRAVERAPYWNQNGTDDLVRRDRLDLPRRFAPTRDDG